MKTLRLDHFRNTKSSSELVSLHIFHSGLHLQTMQWLIMINANREYYPPKTNTNSFLVKTAEKKNKKNGNSERNVGDATPKQIDGAGASIVSSSTT